MSTHSDSLASCLMSDAAFQPEDTSPVLYLEWMVQPAQAHHRRCNLRLGSVQTHGCRTAMPRGQQMYRRPSCMLRCNSCEQASATRTDPTGSSRRSAPRGPRWCRRSCVYPATSPSSLAYRGCKRAANAPPGKRGGASSAPGPSAPAASGTFLRSGACPRGLGRAARGRGLPERGPCPGPEGAWAAGPRPAASSCSRSGGRAARPPGPRPRPPTPSDRRASASASCHSRAS
mmetsp:Transcript_9128/g.25534  ORF Transcript_9128/g.25534 Transcript_9128/m.25534 type:complete len:231 (-) Transcript_9128:1893-2585(-)